MTVHVRTGLGHELNDVVDLWGRCGLVPGFVGFRNELQRKLDADPDLFLVAVDDGGIVGALTGGFDGRTAWVSRLAVHPGHRRRGVGRLLVDALRDRLARRGAPSDRLVVLDDHDAGRRFFTGIGWEPDRPATTYRLPGGGTSS